MHDISVKHGTYPLDSPQIAPLGTRAEDAQWRLQLKKGDEVDAMDRCQSWYTATVVAPETRTEFAMPMHQIGFRQYHAEGDKEDEMGTYFGFSKQLDEHIGAFTVRLQRPHTYARAQAKGAVAARREADQDALDMRMLAHEGELIYATERAACKSTMLVALLNKFGAADGFDKLLAVVRRAETSLEHVYYLLDMLSKAASLYHRSFVRQFWPRLRDAVQAKLLGATSQQLRQIKKERVDDLVVCLWDRLMGRLYGEADLQVQKQIFNLDIGILFMAQNFLEKRIDGAKYIDTVCRLALQGTLGGKADKSADFTRPLVDKLRDKDVLLQFFSKSRIHSQLVQRSGGLLKLMFAAQALSDAEMNLVWDNCATDEAIHIEFYKVLTEVAAQMTQDLALFYVGKIQQRRGANLRAAEVSLLQEMATKSFQKGNLRCVRHVLALLWDCIFSEAQK